MKKFLELLGFLTSYSLMKLCKRLKKRKMYAKSQKTLNKIFHMLGLFTYKIDKAKFSLYIYEIKFE